MISVSFAMSNTSAFYTGSDQNLGELVDSYHEVFENSVNNNPSHTVKDNLVVFEDSMNLRLFSEAQMCSFEGFAA